MKTLVIIPAYNEEESILRVVRNLENADIDCDYIVINDCSKDSTGKILDDNNINHVDLPVNLGLTGAVQTGYKYAYYNNYDAAIQFDGDGQHLPEYIPSLVKEIENGYDIVIGSRFVDEKKHFSMRMLGSRIITAMIKLTTGATINDPTSGMRIINKELIKDYAFELKGATVYLTQCKKEQIRLITDSKDVLTGAITNRYEATSLYSSNNNLVEVFKDALANEIQLLKMK